MEPPMTSSGIPISSSAGYGPPPSYFDPALEPYLTPPVYSDVERGLAWFKLIFGLLFLAIGIPLLARFFYLRNVFEIKARSSLLASMSGIFGLMVLTVPMYLSAVILFDFPLNLEALPITQMVPAFALHATVWARCIRLGVSYRPRVKRRFPWLLSEKAWIPFVLLFGLASSANGLYRAYTINDSPFETFYYLIEMQNDRDVLSLILAGVTVVISTLIWRVDDLFGISKEVIGAIVIQLSITAVDYLSSRYFSEEVAWWVNLDNIVWTGSIIMFGIVIIDPLRRHAFNPIAVANPALARANDRRRANALMALKRSDVSELTEPESIPDSQQSGSASAPEMATPRRRWSYESLAAVPELAASFRTFSFRALCEESVIFLEEVTKYQNGDFLACEGAGDTQKEAFLAMVARFIEDGSPDEINISYSDKTEIINMARNGGELFDMLEDAQKTAIFGGVYVEIRYMLESNLLQRFTETQEFRDLSMQAPPAPGRRRKRRVTHSQEVDEGQSQAPLEYSLRSVL